MNKKGNPLFAGIIPLLWLTGILLFVFIAGGSIFTYRISHSPYLWVILGIGVFILFQQNRKR